MRFLILAALVFIGCAHTPTDSSAATVADRVAESKGAVLRLEGNVLNCSAFHIGRGILISAAHCDDPLARIVGSGMIVRDHSGGTQPATVLVTDRDKDLMVLRVAAIPAAKLDLEANHAANLEGDPVVAIGFPSYIGGIAFFDVGFYKGLTRWQDRVLALVSDASAVGYSGGPIINVRTGKVLAVQHMLGNRFDKLDPTRPEMTNHHWLALAVLSNDVLNLLAQHQIEYGAQR